ncbi:MAG: hypothetical protein RL748_661 [Pseudomonadota bacterium]
MSDAVMNNNTGAPVTGPDHHNRVVEKEQLLDNARKNLHTNLSAARRTGKTSLMREVVATLKMDDWAAVEIDFSPCQTLAEFMALFQEKLQAATADNSPVKSKIKAGFVSFAGLFDREIGFSVLGNDVTLGAAENKTAPPKDFAVAFAMLGDAIEALAQEAKAKRLIMALDELPIFLNRYHANAGDDPQLKATRTSEIAALLYALREQRQRPANKVFWLHCGSIGLESFAERLKLTHSLSGLQVFPLEAFTPSHTRSMLQRLWAGKGRTGPMPAPAVEQIITRLDWLVPSFTQQLFHLLYSQRAAWADPEQPTAADVDRAWDKMISAEHRSYFLHWDTRLDEQLGKVAAARARLILNAASNIKRKHNRATLFNEVAAQQPQADATLLEQEVRYLLGTLERDGYLVESQNRYIFRSPLLRDYWQKHCVPIPRKASKRSQQAGSAT